MGLGARAEVSGEIGVLEALFGSTTSGPAVWLFSKEVLLIQEFV